MPYDLDFLPEVSTYLAMYNPTPPARYAACNVLFGHHPPQGRLPIAIDSYPSGWGMAIEADEWQPRTPGTEASSIADSEPN
jgi:hypothetical protein